MSSRPVLSADDVVASVGAAVEPGRAALAAGEGVGATGEAVAIAGLFPAGVADGSAGVARAVADALGRVEVAVAVMVVVGDEVAALVGDFVKLGCAVAAKVVAVGVDVAAAGAGVSVLGCGTRVLAGPGVGVLVGRQGTVPGTHGVVCNND